MSAVEEMRAAGELAQHGDNQHNLEGTVRSLAQPAEFCGMQRGEFATMRGGGVRQKKRRIRRN